MRIGSGYTLYWRTLQYAYYNNFWQKLQVIECQWWVVMGG